MINEHQLPYDWLRKLTGHSPAHRVLLYQHSISVVYSTKSINPYDAESIAVSKRKVADLQEAFRFIATLKPAVIRIIDYRPLDEITHLIEFGDHDAIVQFILTHS